ncbi:MAG TPA: hypothetical protein VJK02_06650 [Anaerolineales bacterium]|nr:hypothetical protein [Anaerolineales bacterium]
MDLRKRLTNLTYVGKVQGQRQTYHVFEGGDSYLIASPSRSKPNAGYFNLVEKTAVDYVLKRIKGERGITSQLIVQRARRTKRIVDSLHALNILYVLVALGKAKIDRKREGRRLYFDVSSA